VTCHDAREYLSELVDDGLEPIRPAEVDAHLAGCAECRRELAALRATLGALRGLERPRAPLGFVESVMRRAYPTPWYRRAAARLFLPLSIKLPIEAAAVVVVAGLAMLVVGRTPELRRPALETTAQRPVPESSSPAAPAPEAASDAAARKAPASEGPALEAPRPRAQAPEPSTPGVPGPEPLPAAPPVSGHVEGQGAPDEKAASLDRREMARSLAAPPPSPAATAARAPADVAGRLSVRDQAAAITSLADLLAAVGGREIARRREASDTVVDVVVPGARHDEFLRGLAALGAWTPVGPPAATPAAPDQLRVSVRIAE
jgi:hypothetical protein